MYRKSVWFSADKNFLIVKKYHAAHAQPENEKNRRRRQQKTEGTGWKQEDINRRRRTENIQRLLLDNFRPGDWYVTLTYRTGAVPDTEQQAKADFEKFKRRIRSFYAKEKLACTWIGVIEHLHGGGRVHCHIMLPALPAEKLSELKKLWPHGNVDCRFYGGGQMDAYRLASYYTKETAEKHASSVMTSRNLLRTEPRKEKTEAADTWTDKFVPPEGYAIISDLSFSMYTEAGYPMQITVLEKIKKEYLPRPPLETWKKKRRCKRGIIKKTSQGAAKEQAAAQT